MSNTTSTTKKASAKTAQTVTEVKLHKFVGIMYQFTNVQNSTDRICWFDTLSKDKSHAVKFSALLTDEDAYLAGYIKGHKVLEVTVKELPEVNGKKRFEIVNMMTESERINYNALLQYAEQAKA
jgi:hypothetical protein